MTENHRSGRLVVILHADIAGSTVLVRHDERLAHERIQDAFRRFSNTIAVYEGRVRELRGDALLAEFERASDAVMASLAFQAENAARNKELDDDIRPAVRVGIAMGEVIVADKTVTGTGVVLAQRVEQLASEGGVCITGAIHEALPQRMPFDQENLGDRRVKGFDEKVRIYRVALRSGASISPPRAKGFLEKATRAPLLSAAILAVTVVVLIGTYWYGPWTEATSQQETSFTLPDKPSIAVLPFTNMSDDPEQEYFADGITEDLITDLSKLSGLFVIARNSTFTYKGSSIKVDEVAGELGVRFVLEGSVRRAGEQVRINAQLIDALTGGHVWAERYDGVLDDIFALQDQVTQKIVAALSVSLNAGETTRTPIETTDSKAYDLFLRAWDHYRLGTAEGYARAIPLLEQTLDIDPDYDRAYAALAAVYWESLWKGWWQESLGLTYFHQFFERARGLLRKSLEHPTALTHQVASEWDAYFDRKPDAALAEAEQALSLDPNNPAGHLAMANALLADRRPQEAKESIDAAMRLDPYYPSTYLIKLAQAQFMLEDYENAAENLERVIADNPDDDWGFAYLAATYGQLDLPQKAREALNRANTLRAKAGWGPVTLVAASHQRFRWPGNRSSLRDGLRKAGASPGGEWLKLVDQSTSPHKVKGVPNIDVQTAKALHERGAVFVDLWRDWPTRHIPGAYYLEWANEEGWLFNEAALSRIAGKDTDIVLSSPYSNDSATASALAVSRGFHKVYNFPGGIEAWIAAGHPVEAGE